MGSQEVSAAGEMGDGRRDIRSPLLLSLFRCITHKEIHMSSLEAVPKDERDDEYQADLARLRTSHEQFGEAAGLIAGVIGENIGCHLMF